MSLYIFLCVTVCIFMCNYKFFLFLCVPILFLCAIILIYFLCVAKPIYFFFSMSDSRLKNAKHAPAHIPKSS